MHSGSLAGPAEAHAKHLANNHRKPGLCCSNNVIHKARRVKDAVKRFFVLNYVFALLLLSVRCCSNQKRPNGDIERAIHCGANLSPRSQYIVYAQNGGWSILEVPWLGNGVPDLAVTSSFASRQSALPVLDVTTAWFFTVHSAEKARIHQHPVVASSQL